MAYDVALADRIRALLQGTSDLREKKMFGGFGFLVGGHLATSAYQDGGLMIRCSATDCSSFCAEPGARPMMRKNKQVSGWVLIAADHIVTDEDLRRWVSRGRDFASAQPPK
jgi:TfoX/Sxy family transcriptional regulator of competence genes